MSKLIPPTADEADTALPIECGARPSKDREELIELGAKASVASFAETFAGGGWADPPRWEDHSERGQWRFKQAFAAALSAIEAAGFAVLRVSDLTDGQRIIVGLQQAVGMAQIEAGRVNRKHIDERIDDAFRRRFEREMGKPYAYSPKTSGGDTPPTTEEEGA